MIYFIKNISVLIGSLIFLFLVGEIITRLIPSTMPLYFPTDLPEMYTKNKNYIIGLTPNFVHKKWGEVAIRINSEGFRDEEVTQRKSENTFRILGLGDSIAFGWGFEVEKSYSNLLEEMLNKKYQPKKFELINAAVPGHSSYHELLYFQTEGKKYQPDLVLLGFCLNDITSQMDLKNYKQKNNAKEEVSLPKGLHIQAPSEKDTKSLIKSLIPTTFPIPGKTYLRRSAFYRLIAFRWQILMLKLGKVKSYQIDDWLKKWEAAWPTTREILKELNSEIINSGAKMVLVVFPIRQQLKVDLDHKSYLDKPQDLLANFAQEEKIFYLDLLPFYRKEKRFLYLHSGDEWHPNPLGHKIAAERILSFLEENNLLLN